MKKLFFTLTFVCVLFIAKSQTQTQPNPITSNAITYKREVPPSDTYSIVKNTSGAAIPDQILEEVNLYRKYDVDYLWIVNKDIEILIYYVGKIVSDIDQQKNLKDE